MTNVALVCEPPRDVLAILLSFLAILFVLGRTRQLIGSMVLISIAVLIYSLKGLYSEAQIADRVTSDNLAMEVSVGRVSIWKDAFLTAVDNPIFGVGFRNFGDEYLAIAPDTGVILHHRSNAHGFFQEVFVEHGLFFGFALFTSWLFSLSR